MSTPSIIYLRAVAIYVFLTVPALVFPFIYFISILYVFLYGWIAWVLFTIIYLITVFCNPSFLTKMLILAIGVVVAVLFAFEMLEVLGVEQDIWYSGAYLLFPVAAIVSGWISLAKSYQKVRIASREMLLGISGASTSEQNIHNNNN